MTCTNTAPFTDTFPGNDGTDVPSVPHRAFNSIPGHCERLSVTAVAEPDCTEVHIGHAVLTVDTTRELIAHLEEILEAAEDSPTEETTPEQPRPGYTFPNTRKWHGEQVPASPTHHYPTVDQCDALNLQYVATPDGPLVLVDGNRPISLDATYTLMQDMALYRSATLADQASQNRAATATA